MIERVMQLLRGARPLQPQVVGTCPVCHRGVSERDQRVSLRGGLAAHRDCATYRVRHLDRARALRRS